MMGPFASRNVDTDDTRQSVAIINRVITGRRGRHDQGAMSSRILERMVIERRLPFVDVIRVIHHGEKSAREISRRW
jgi:hypothetical protein